MRRAAQKTRLKTTTRTAGGRPDFKSELLPLRSPLLGQSLLVSFPPLIDMLKFSGSSYLIRGQHMAASPQEGSAYVGGFYGRPAGTPQGSKIYCTRGPSWTAHFCLEA